MLHVPRLMISAPYKSSGKTTLTLAVAAYFAGRGESVSCFKKGPDYIDPMWHELAAGRASCNLDIWLMGREGCLDAFFRYAREGSLSLIEGNHGLHDGMALDGSDSSAGLAALLRAPVLLVFDSRSMNRGAAAIVMGMQAMHPEVVIAGVVLNRVRSLRHAEKQQRAIETFCGIPVLGAIPAEAEVAIPERHLGLTSAEEMPDARQAVAEAAAHVARHCDMEAIRSLFDSAPPFRERTPEPAAVFSGERVRIGVFRDKAFCFYYGDNLRALESFGAELVYVDSLHERALPDVDALYIGGGFPESFLAQLEGNRGLADNVRRAVESGMPLYAECGGLIYLCRSAIYRGETFALAGVLPFDIGFQPKPAAHGYLSLKSSTTSPWFEEGEEIRAHEFHYSSPIAPQWPSASWQFLVTRGSGVTGEREGVLYKNLFASYAHLHAASNPAWAPRFVSLAAKWKKQKKSSFLFLYSYILF